MRFQNESRIGWSFSNLLFFLFLFFARFYLSFLSATSWRLLWQKKNERKGNEEKKNSCMVFPFDVLAQLPATKEKTRWKSCWTSKGKSYADVPGLKTRKNPKALSLVSGFFFLVFIWLAHRFTSGKTRS